ncbi:Rap1-interacting factor 1 N terminal-domain-containing protein [Powellomyces hirtus]|nr:Rap1-interacting factor 1 N terminal-domain-containing protein [Powellomyces hirtus]
MTGMLTQVRNVLEGAPLDDIILVLAEDGELQRSDAWSAVLHHIRHAESSGADVPVLSEAQLHIMVPAFLQDIKLQNSGAVQHEILFQSAIRCVGYCLYRIQFLSNASRKQIHSILDAIILVLKNGIQAKFVYLAVWAMAIHRVEVESVLEELCDDLLKGLITSMRFGDEVEAVSKDFFAGLHKLFRKIPNLAVTKSKIWFPAVFETLLADDRKVVEFANAFFPSVTEHFVALNSQYASEIKNLTNSEIGPIIELFHAKTEHENLFTAWGHLVAMLGSSLHRSPNLNTILKIVEIGFNSEVTPKRVAAHKAWRRLILNFAQDGHLRNPKRTGLILLPILNGFKYEKMHVAKMECARTFMFLLVHLSHFAPLRSFMKTSVLPVVQMARTDSKLIDMVLLASILNVTASSTPASEKPSLRQSYIEIDPKVPGALLQRIRPNMPAATWTAEDLSVFLDIIEISVDRWATYPQMRGKMLQLWAQAIQFINRSMESSRRDLAPLAAGLNLIWKILQKPEASDHAHALAETFEITLPEDANEVTDEDRETQYDHAKTAMKLLSNIRRMLSPNTKGQEHMTNIAKTISAQYQLALAHVDPLATRPHPRAQNLMEKLSSDGHERVGDENGTPRKKKHASLGRHLCFQLHELKADVHSL